MEEVGRNGKLWMMLKEMEVWRRLGEIEECGGCWKKRKSVEDVGRNDIVWKMLEEMEECEGCWKSWKSVEDVGRNGRVWRMLKEIEECE